MEIDGIKIDLGNPTDTNSLKLSELIREAWKKAGVMENDALFREAFVYGEKELKRTLEVLPDQDLADPLNVMIQLELQFLAQAGHFPPAKVEETANEIVSILRVGK